MSVKLTIGVLIAFALLAIVCLFEKKYPQALYWFAGALINISVLWMGAK